MPESRNAHKILLLASTKNKLHYLDKVINTEIKLVKLLSSNDEKLIYIISIIM